MSKAPDLPGFTFIELIGSGGYADVFLYEQELGRRQVAVKVLDESLLPSGSANDYAEEANVMAMVSEHTYIVQVLQANISTDGRPYLVMEYYPGSNFQQRAKREHMSVPEVVRVGIQIACAVDTAHSAGILHRDIKPANILTNKFRKPGLTDFGIAAVEGPTRTSSEAGLSIPWSPPEALGDVVTERRADVYSLAASCYTMLVGRSPFETPNGDNRQLALMNRIERDQVPSIGRADVPAQLERVLATAMAKDPSHRPATAAEFARQLQAVESEMQLPVTELELETVGHLARARSADDDDDDVTHAKAIIQIEAQSPAYSVRVRAPHGPPSGASLAPSAPVIPVTAGEQPTTDPLSGRERVGIYAEPDIEQTVQRAAPNAPELDEYESETGISKSILVSIAVGVVLALIVGAFALFGGGESEPDEDPDVAIAEINDNFGDDAGAPVGVTPLAVSAVGVELLESGSYEFSWEDMGSDVSYAIRIGDATSTTEITETTYIASEPCLEVEVIAASGLISAPTRGCADG